MGLGVATYHAGVHGTHRHPFITTDAEDLPLRKREHTEVKFGNTKRAHLSAGYRNSWRVFIQPRGSKIPVHALSQRPFHRHSGTDYGAASIVADMHQGLSRRGVELECHTQRRKRGALTFEARDLLLQTVRETARPQNRAPQQSAHHGQK